MLRFTAALVLATLCAHALPTSEEKTRGAFFFCEQRAGRVGYIGWPPIGCTTDADCATSSTGVNGSYCMNDKSKTAPFFCHEPEVFIKSGLDKPVGIAVDTETMQVFYNQDDQTTPNTSWPLSTINVDGTGERTVLPALVDPQGLDVSPSTKKIYYTEHHAKRVGVVDYDGSNSKTLLQFKDSDNAFPSDVKFDATNEKVFFMVEQDVTTGGQIMYMNADGTNVTSLLGDITRAYGLTLDVAHKKVYYISGGHGGFIGYISYDGKEHGKVLDLLEWPYMLDYDPSSNLLVFSTTGVGDGVIRTVTPDGLNVTETLALGFAPMGVTFGKVPLK